MSWRRHSPVRCPGRGCIACRGRSVRRPVPVGRLFRTIFSPCGSLGDAQSFHVHQAERGLRFGVAFDGGAFEQGGGFVVLLVLVQAYAFVFFFGGDDGGGGRQQAAGKDEPRGPSGERVVLEYRAKHGEILYDGISCVAMIAKRGRDCVAVGANVLFCSHISSRETGLSCGFDGCAPGARAGACAQGVRVSGLRHIPASCRAQGVPFRRCCRFPPR